MEFKEFKQLQQEHIAKMLKGKDTLFTVDLENSDVLWNTYLDSFPEGTNKIYRERREFDCSCCKQFIRQFGNVVTIDNNYNTITIWDFETGEDMFQPVINALSQLVKSYKTTNVFITKQAGYGADQNHELLDDGTVQTWEHFYVRLPKKFKNATFDTEASVMSDLRSIKDVFKRSLEEISRESIETVLELVAQKSLYRGEEWAGVLKKFLSAHKKYNKLPEENRNNFCWAKSVELGGAIGKIKNHSIGVLLLDITDNVNLDEAVRKYEAIVAPTNYKRPKAIFTKKMVADAKETLEKLGLVDSLSRRHAVIEDVTINNVLFANRAVTGKMSDDIFDELSEEVAVNPRKFERIEEVGIEHFVKEVLPTTNKLEVLFENRHAGNLVSLIAPQNKDSKPFFKWNNGFSWAYDGNIADSMKQNVKNAGGKVDGVLRFSIQWNENNDNKNDLDAHCKLPVGGEIFYGNKQDRFSTGMLDVDIIDPNGVAVENITWSSLSRMPHGTYEFFVHNYSHRGGKSGFSAEIEFDGQVFSFEYRKDIKQKGSVPVAKVNLSEAGFEITESMPSNMSSVARWNLQTNQFCPVSMAMFSPNYWDDQVGIGNRHYFFILDNCLNDSTPNGFFNEFLKEDFTKHKHVFEALGSKMSVEDSTEQLSGVGFSSTQRNSVVCKVEGNISRILRINF